MTFTRQQAQLMRRQGHQPSDILKAATRAGVEYPDAVWLVSSALQLRTPQVQTMEQEYLQ